MHMWLPPLLPYFFASKVYCFWKNENERQGKKIRGETRQQRNALLYQAWGTTTNVLSYQTFFACFLCSIYEEEGGKPLKPGGARVSLERRKLFLLHLLLLLLKTFSWILSKKLVLLETVLQE